MLAGRRLLRGIDNAADAARTGNRACKTALTADGIPATATLLTGDNPAESIAELLAARPRSFALTATHGRTGLARLLLGSVTAELLTRSRNPVLVTRTL